jgi:peptidoglycan L-alanyl-D-glutamate endopeptidase CwlK
MKFDSRNKLKDCHDALKVIVEELANVKNFVVCCGFRGEKEQNEAFKNGNSKLKFPLSRHNEFPSRAVDLAPCNDGGVIDWNNIDAFKDLAKEFKRIAKEKNIKIVWGGDWKSFKDYPHYELS